MESYIVNIINGEPGSEIDRMMILSDSMEEAKKIAIRAIVTSYHPDKIFSSKLYSIEEQDCDDYGCEFILSMDPRFEEEDYITLLIQMDEYYSILEGNVIYD